MSIYRLKILSTLIIISIMIVPFTQPGVTKASLATAITVSGNVTDSGGPVKDVKIFIRSSTDSQETFSDNSGNYSITIQTDGELWLHVRPELSMRLSWINMHWGDVTGNITQDFSLLDGNLLSILPVTSSGIRISGGGIWFDILPLGHELPEREWYDFDRDIPSGYYQGVFPPDIYNVVVNNLPQGYYPTTQAFDLRTGDVSSNMVVNENFIHPVPYNPPNATKIDIGSPDGLGEAVVTGAPGAVLPLAHVLLVNLNSFHQSQTISVADGSFSAKIFAPPGSAIMVKHGPASHRWSDLEVGLSEGINPFPGTIINLPHTHTAAQNWLPFAASGAIEVFVDDPGSTVNYVASAWAMEGSMGPVVATTGVNLDNYTGQDSSASTGASINPGDPIQIESKIRLYSQAISGPDVSGIDVGGWLGLMMVFDSDGESIPAQNYFMSNMLTPSGFPIQRTGRPIEWLGQHFDVINLNYLGDHVIEGDISVEMNIPVDLIEGIYRPILALEFNGVPGSTDWLAANVTQFTFLSHEAALPPIMIGEVQSPKLVWRLMMDDFVQGTRGTGAQEDQGLFELASQIVSQGAPFYVPPIDERTGQPITYRLEPFLPLISFTDRRMPTPPLIPFDLPGGELCVTVQQPDSQVINLGCESFDQSFNRTKTTRGGQDLNIGTVQLDDVYSLKTASGKFRLNFEQYGHHVITMTGEVTDQWGNTYQGGGTYDLWVAQPLDIDPGVLPGTPLAVGDSINPAVQVNPRVPAEISLTVTHFPESDPAQVEIYPLSGSVNQFGYFSSDEPAITLNKPGEYRLDLTAKYLDQSGVLYMGELTWGGVVMTPDNQADLIAHGRSGVDSLESIPGHWFVSCRDLDILPGAISHTFNPYFNGDIVWSRLNSPECDPGETSGGDSLLMGASVQDTVGVIQTAIVPRANSNNIETYQPGTLSERIIAEEIPLFSSSQSGLPVQMVPEQDIDQIAYSYRSSQRPGVRVREVVAEDSQSGGYWRLDTLYDDQLGVGILGDQPNDFKFQYVGIVYRDLDSGKSEYLGHGSGWVFIPDDDLTGTRVMPPFSGPGNGGWTTEGGPLLTLRGEAVHMFILPTGVRPGSILQVGDTFHFAGHVMPTLDSQVEVTVTSPSGAPHSISGQASSIGYFYDQSDDFIVNEPGLWSVDVNISHDGQCSGGSTIPPYPSGDVLGSENGRYWFYVVPSTSPRLNVFAPSPGFLSFSNQVTPITISGTVPSGFSDANVYYTISMPGYILQQGKVQPSKGTYSIIFDPAQLKNDYPNLDLIGRDDFSAGLADTFTIGLFLKAQDGGKSVFRANSITIQGEQVFVGNLLSAQLSKIHLPLINKGD